VSVVSVAETRTNADYRDVLLDGETGRTLRVYPAAQGAIVMRVFYAAEGVLDHYGYGELVVDLDAADAVVEAVAATAREAREARAREEAGR
jgi:hypothetical protein